MDALAICSARCSEQMPLTTNLLSVGTEPEIPLSQLATTADAVRDSLNYTAADDISALSQNSTGFNQPKDVRISRLEKRIDEQNKSPAGNSSSTCGRFCLSSFDNKPTYHILQRKSTFCS
ncbi:hypothetical protein ACLKA7_001502 [Drosophila subpalustris]